MIGERFLILITVPMKRFIRTGSILSISIREESVLVCFGEPANFSPPEKRYVSMLHRITRTGTISLRYDNMVHLLLDSSSPKRDLVFMY